MTALTHDDGTAYALECRNVTYRLPSGATLLSELSVQVAPGETLVLLGRSGSGKSTTLRLLNRLLEPTGGEIFVHGRAATSWNPIELRRGMGYVIQDAGLFPHWTVAKNVALVPRLERWPEEKIAARLKEMLELVGLPPEEFAERFPAQLSGGQRQRVGVARALAADPAILLMDEPFAAVDPITRSELQREFRALAARLRKTIVFVTHDIREAVFLATRIAFLADGQLVGVYEPKEFLRTSDTRVQEFTASLHMDTTAGPEKCI